MPDSTPYIDVAVIGAGQAGLAMGRMLRPFQYEITIFERNERVGDSWRQRFDSLKLFSPRELSALPEVPVPGDPAGFPTKDEIADYLEQYAAACELPVKTGCGVKRLVEQEGEFVLDLDDGTTVRSRVAVIATGAFQTPFVPGIAQEFQDGVGQYRIDEYRNPGQLPHGKVLVVGDGGSGRQVALELADTHRVVLATGGFHAIVPERLFNRSTVWWMEALRLSRASRESLLGRCIMKTDPFPGLGLTLGNLRRRGVETAGRLVGADGPTALFSRGAPATVSSVIWAPGYRDRTDWVAISAAKDTDGRFVERRGITPVSNLFHIGRSWQWTRSSALISGVSRDAEYLLPFIRNGLAGGP